MKKTLVKISYAFSVLFFLWIFACGTIGQIYQASSKGHINIFASVAVEIFAAAIAVFAAKFFPKLKISISKLIRQKPCSANIIFFLSFALLLAAQILICAKSGYQAINDANRVLIGAKNFAADGNFENLYRGIVNRPYYFDEYPNNWGILLLLSFCFRAIFLIFGSVPKAAVYVINIAAIDLAAVFTYFLAKRVFASRSKALICFAAIALSPVFWLYAPIAYTDTLSLPFISGSLLLAYSVVSAAQKNKIPKALVLSALVGIVVSAGYSIKGNAGIIAVAFLLFCLAKLGVKKTAAIALCFLVCFAGYSKGLNAVCMKLEISNEQKLDANKVPTEHWIMMALSGRGGYNSDDHDLTMAQPNLEAKKAFNREQIKVRLKEMGFFGLISHLSQKAAYTWEDGQHQAVYQYKDSENKKFAGSKVLVILCGIEHFMLMQFMFFSFLRGFKRNRLEPAALLKLSVLGLAMFLCIWETRSRYLINFLPIMIIIAVNGADFLGYILNRKKEQA